jgi:histidinol-phosphate phosphatase family protein
VMDRVWPPSAAAVPAWCAGAGPLRGRGPNQAPEMTVKRSDTNVTVETGVFLDLNGTLVQPLKPERLDDLTVIPGVVDAVARLSAAGFVCPIVTVQSRIAKGPFSSADFERWFARFAADLDERGARVVGPYVCPHRFAEPCACKKPNTLLYERAALQHEINVTASFVIGDSPDDILAARRLGAQWCARDGPPTPALRTRGIKQHFATSTREE